MKALEERQLPPGDERNLLPPAEEERTRRWPLWKLLLVAGGALVVLALLFFLGYLPRHNRQMAAREAAQREAESTPVANVVKVRRSPAVTNLLLPGTMTPLTEAYIYARASGYVGRRYVDIGDRVRKGQVLAEIQAPDLDAQVAQARADVAQSQQQLQQAQAALENAQATEELNRVTWQRYSVLGEHGAVARQDVDQQLANYKTAAANVHLQEAAIRTSEENVRSNRANLDRLLALQGFKQVIAPFTGVITARNFDIGALVEGGSPQGAAIAPGGGTQFSSNISNQGTTATNISATPPSVGNGGGVGQLYRIAEISVLRILVDVPQPSAPDVRVGAPAKVFLLELPGQNFLGKVTRTSESLDPAARTLVAEVQVANPKAILLPGMYGQVQFSVHRSHPPLLVPGASIMATADGLQVAILTDPTPQQLQQWRREQQLRQQADDQRLRTQPKRIHLQFVQVGRDYGPQIEITHGLAGWEYVVVNPGDFAQDGALVIPQSAPNTAGQGNPQRQGPSERVPSGNGSQSMQAPTAGGQPGKGGGK